MERDMSARRIYGEEETPEGGAGSEFGKKQREEARRKKFGIVTREFKVEDQPWILKVNGKAGKRWGRGAALFFKILITGINSCMILILILVFLICLSGSKVKRRVVLLKTHPTTSSHSVQMAPLRPSLSMAGTTSHPWRSTELSLLRKQKRSGAGKRTMVYVWKEGPNSCGTLIIIHLHQFTGGTRW